MVLRPGRNTAGGQARLQLWRAPCKVPTYHSRHYPQAQDIHGIDREYILIEDGDVGQVAGRQRTEAIFHARSISCSPRETANGLFDRQTLLWIPSIWPR